ncbi:MAG: long-chain fatty acid--CoA ligase [Calditrichaeota bacterium]|nr:MAG: long-chain fatty acid--CoA ligase [Calditrichota bacterium]
MSIPLIERAEGHRERVAIIDREGEHSYAALLEASARVAGHLLAGAEDLQEARVTFMVPPGFQYVAVQWGIWRAGGIAVPHCLTHPPRELDYVLEDTGAQLVVAHPEYLPVLAPLTRQRGIRLLSTEAVFSPIQCALPSIDPARRAMILYTSGTTSRPKGVVLTHNNLTAQITSLIQAWAWVPEDHILHVLPLHHTHGIVNALCCALWAGARCEMLPRFDEVEVWRRFQERPLTLFMAVPTIYVRLIRYWESVPAEQQQALSAAGRKFRLMVSGSAALPVQVFRRWQDITGQVLLERYGMTEIGMALSNPLHGERRPGTVGQPLPGVSVRLVDETGTPIQQEGVPGEIQVKGPNVFLEYWQRPDATRQAFRDGWFCTGDMAVVEQGYYRILGRKSVDIIKTGGYKVSALEIEDVLREHPAIAECAVVGIPDPEWGERVAAAVVLRPSQTLTLETLKAWARQHLAPYKLPRALKIVRSLPRNALGKVTKPAVKDLFSEQPG